MGMQTLFSFGAKSGIEKSEPAREGDQIVHHTGARLVVVACEADGYAGRPTYQAIHLETGRTWIVHEKEVKYISRRG